MDQYYNSVCSLSDSDPDLSFTSITTTTATSARSSFNDNRVSSAAQISRPHPRRHGDQNWEAIDAAVTLSSDGALNFRHLKLVRLLGSGNLGRVFLCRLHDSDRAAFALKVVDRDALTAKKLAHAETEARILSTLDHPFLPTLYARVEASHYTGLVMDYCPNGDLHSLLHRQPSKRLPVYAVRFYAAEVLLALEYLHARGIVYRDLKPENILIRENGHVMLSDFDLCFESEISPRLETSSRVGRRRREERMTVFMAEPTAAFSKSCVGTHEYLAPEMVAGEGHGSGVDWWAFGVLIYELLHGTTPFKGVNQEFTLRNITCAKMAGFQAASDGEEEARDLIGKLLVKNPRRRLGCDKGATDIKRHPFFEGIKWPLMRTYRPPVVPGLAVRRSRQANTVLASSPRKRRYFWKWLSRLLRMKRSRQGLNSNSNYYSYVDERCKLL